MENLSSSNGSANIEAMARTVTWLHLSDLHSCKIKTGWDADRVLAALQTDLQLMRERHGVKPDLIFFTGDAAYGQIGSDLRTPN